jgi:hypothetical protein
MKTLENRFHITGRRKHEIPRDSVSISLQRCEIELEVQQDMENIGLFSCHIFLCPMSQWIELIAKMGENQIVSRDATAFLLRLIEVCLQLLGLTFRRGSFTLKARMLTVQFAESITELLLTLTLFNNIRIFGLPPRIPSGPTIFSPFIRREETFFSKLVTLTPTTIKEAFYLFQSAVMLAALNS